MKIVFAPDQARPAGAEESTEDELQLELYVDNSLSPLPSLYSDDDEVTLSLASLAWDDNDEEQPERYSRTKSSRTPSNSLACRIASQKV